MIEAIKQAYAALNQNDIPGFVKLFSKEILRVEFEGSPMAGTYRGIEAVAEHVKKGRGSWAEGSCTPERFVVAGDRIVVTAHVHVRLKNEAEFREGHTGDVFTFQNGKIIEFRTFASEQQALEWVGVK